MPDRSFSTFRAVIPFVVVVLAAALTTYRYGLVMGLVVAGVGSLLVWAGLAVAARQERTEDPSRRRFLALSGLVGLLVALGGAELGRYVRRLTRPDPEPVLQNMARGLGSEAMEYLRRGHYPAHSGELQLVVAPFSSSNYAPESKSLVKNDPRTSHAAVWPYLERVPIVVHAPGVLKGTDTSEDRVSLADLAPTAAKLMGLDFAAPDGVPLPGVPQPAKAPKVIVTFVIDGGGWNVLRHWSPETPGNDLAWPHLMDLMKSEGTLTYTNAVMGSFPSVTACAHATIGTGAYPRHHGISGHNVRIGRDVVKAYGLEGHAEPQKYLKSPTLAEAWSEHTSDGAWIGEIGYQIWHLGMIGRGGTRPLGDKPVAIYWNDADAGRWASQNPDMFRMPNGMPARASLSSKIKSYFPPEDAATIDQGGVKLCCSPPIVEYQGDVIEAAFENEPIGKSGETSLLYINFKSPDYTGHVVNMLDPDEAAVLSAVDREIERVRKILADNFDEGEYALIVTADHGQCPLPDKVGGVRLDPIQLENDLNREFGTSVFHLLDYVAPSELFVNPRALADADLRLEDIAAFLHDYRYRDNIGDYVPRSAVEWNHLDEEILAAVMPATFLEELTDASVEGYGAGRYNRIPGVEPGPPQSPSSAFGDQVTSPS
ncbi:MAG: alkaline phosphatase family protein [Actinomycetota bacterium]